MGDFTEQKPEVFWEVVKLDFNRGIRNKKSGKVKKFQLWVSFRYFKYNKLQQCYTPPSPYALEGSQTIGVV